MKKKGKVRKIEPAEREGAAWSSTAGMRESERLAEGWSVELLGDVAAVRAGGSAPQGERWFGGKNPFVRVQHLDEGNDWVRRWDLITDEAVREYSLRLFPAGTIVLPKSGASIRLEKRAMLMTDAHLVSHLAAVNANVERIDQEFLFFALRSMRLAQEKADGYPTLNLTELANTKVGFPSGAEQRAIAAVLRTVQRLKEATEKVIAAACQLKSSLMKHLFTYGPVPFDQADHVPLRETEIGQIPKHWHLPKLGEIVEMHTGGTPSRSNPAFWNGGIPWVKTGEVNYNIIRQTEETISEEGLKGSAAKVTPRGTLLVAMYGQGVTRGRVAILGIEATLNQACAAVFPKNTTTTEFLYSVFVHGYERIRNMGHGAHQTNLSMTLLEQVLIPLPPLPEQRQIAAKLAAVDAKLAAEERRRDALDALFESLLHHLMTGKLRLPEFVASK